MIAERYEQAATVVVSSIDFTVWDQAFPANCRLASVTVNGLRRCAYCLILDRASARRARGRPGQKNS